MEGMRSRAFAQTIFGAEPFTERALARADHLAVMGTGAHYGQMIQRMVETRPEELTRFAVRYLGAAQMRRVDVDPLPLDARPPPGLVRETTAAPLRIDLVDPADFGPPPVIPAPP